MKKNTISLDGNNNIVIQDANKAEITINTNNAEDINKKLNQLAREQIEILQQMAMEQSGKISDLFKSQLNKIASQKNYVGGGITAHDVNIGDKNEVHYHYYPKKNTALPKKLTLEIPRLSEEHIVGRTKELEDLRSLLIEKREALLLNGIGGIGKTTIAQVYVDKYWEEYHHIAWITQNPGGSFLMDFINTTGLRKNLNISDTITEPKDTFNEIIRKLNAIDDLPNLLMLDNVDEGIEPLKDRLPSPPNWHILLTSREELNGFNPVYLDFLSTEDAFRLFKKHYTRNHLNDKQIKELIKKVDYHTLTIEILAKTAMKQRYSYGQLEKALSKNSKAFIKIDRAGTNHKIEKITSYLCSIFSMSRLNEDEIWLMQQMVCLPSDFHNYESLYELIKPEVSNKHEVFAETITDLTNMGWLLNNNETDSYKLHMVVGEVVKKTQLPDPCEISGLIESITELLNIDQSKDNPVVKFQWVPFGKQILSILDGCKNMEADIENKISKLKNNLALVLKALGDFNGAKILLEKAMASDEKNFGEEHPTTAVSYSNLALVLQDLGDFNGAKILLEKAMASDEKNFGEKHPTTAVSYSNLALVLKDLG
ncbi:MAG: tetratricopeptide repeat protein, partial [Bacteroidales bacterium]|nr:tetratricopeptide repeat protein [Bacteroidales bacterium]